MPMIRSLIKIFFCIVLISGCLKKPVPPHKDSSPLKIPGAFEAQVRKTDRLEDYGYFFSDPGLSKIIQQALARNFDVRAIRAKVLQAQAALKKESASFWPTIDYSAGGQRSHTRTKKSSTSASTSDGSHSWDASLTGAWSPDIWGENNAGQSAEQANVAAAQNDLIEARYDLIEEIASNWVDLIAVRTRNLILKKQVDVNLKQLELQKLRYSNGKTSALDVSRQREALAEVSSQQPLLERQEKTLINAIQLLAGELSPVSDLEIKKELPEIKPVSEAGVPASLLENRPDIRAARERLYASEWDVYAAEADLLPSLTITARSVFSSGRLDLLFQNWVGSLTAAFAGTLFDGGEKDAEIQRRKAIVLERTQTYAATVARAIYEVENLLITIRTQDDFIKLLEEELELARLTLKDAWIQYWNGQSTYFSYLEVLSGIEQLERQLVAEKATALKERIKLSRSLGFQTIKSLPAAKS